MDTAIKIAYAEQLKREGRSAVLVDVPIGEQGTTVDVMTDDEMVFCTFELTAQSALSLESKLHFYGGFLPRLKKVVVTQHIVDAKASERLNRAGIKVVIISGVDAVAYRVTSTNQGRNFDSVNSVYHYPALDSVSGGDGLQASLIAIAFVLMTALIGMSLTAAALR